MRDRFWLIQRGKIRDNYDEKTKFLSGSSDALIDPDYMGSSEFEWGAIPNAYVRILYRFNHYQLNDTGIKTTTGKNLYLFCEKLQYDSIMEELKRYKKEHYQLKEWSSFPEHFDFLPSNPTAWQVRDHEHHLRTNFWWCIDINDFRMETSKYIGDWIAFVADDKFSKKFFNILSFDRDNFIFSYTEKEQKDKYESALKW